MTTKLSAATLASLPANVAVPAYDRARLKPGILHFGVGNFHRAHQAVYLDDLFNAGLDHDWALVGAGVFDGEKKGRAMLEAQDWLTTVVEQDSGHMQARVTGAMIDFLEPGRHRGDHRQAGRSGDPHRLADHHRGRLFHRRGHRASSIRRIPTSSPTRPISIAPKTVFGLILAGLSRRRRKGMPPFTIMSCDNIPHNGHVTADAVIGLARLVDADLADWVEENVAFPNGMVDRITPATTDRERATLATEFGVEDGWPVFCEPFRQWVLEDNFPLGRPALEKVGVQFVEDVSPFELMKIRILNGGHAIIAYPGGLMDIHFVHEAMQEPLIAAFLAKLETDEIIPTVPPVPGVVLDGLFRAHRAPLLQSQDRRHGAPALPRRLEPAAEIHHPDHCRPADGGRGVTGWRSNRRSGAATASARAIPARSSSRTIPNWDRLQATARAAKNDPGAWLAMEDIYGAVGTSPVFRDGFAHALGSAVGTGARETLTRYLAGTL